MRNVKTLASVAVAAFLAAGAVVAVAGPASAVPEGSKLDGHIFWFSQAGGLDANTAATQISSGVSPDPTTGLNPRHFVSLATDQKCPDGTLSIQAMVRIPQVGVPEDEWTEVAVTAQDNQLDAAGRYYIQEPPDRLSKSEIFTYTKAHSGTGDFPYLVVCRDASGNGLGYFQTTLTVTGTDASNYSWSIPKADLPATGPTTTPTATTLSITTNGTKLVLTAAVSPAVAGTMTFLDGSTALGTQAVDASGTASITITPSLGRHVYSASFAPADTSKYDPSQSGGQVHVVGTAPGSATGELVLTVPEMGAGALTLAVNFNGAIPLQGARSGDRVTASADFPTVTVMDTRSDETLSNWEVTAQASDFTGTAGTVGAKYLGWKPAQATITTDVEGPLEVVAGASVFSNLDDAESAGLSTGAALGSTRVPGRGTTAMGATLNAAIPGSAVEGTYTSTVTVTLLAE